jgi:demethylmenaquinone methyltransferase/2-methoxy-6-polyprenyl-1,4-benzoquinol methylase
MSRPPDRLSPERIIAEYDRCAPYINFGYALMFPQRVRFMKRHVLPQLGIERGQAVLDLCCGAGHNLPLLADAVGPRGTILGVDFSTGMLERARERIVDRPQVTLLHRDAYLIGEYAPHRFDRVLCSFGLGLMTDPVAFLRAARAALKPGGRIALLDQTPFTGLLRVLNPLVYLAMRPISVNNVAIFQLIRRGLLAIPEVFPNVRVKSHHAGALFVAVATAEAEQP